ncbi:hypothetical protein TOPH_00533 [Tolypocladium ophioglossoides CBS 100239]|uniref:Amidohydrolase-related domain-containing protein n=1 Tax=Tolypocladium ophioglossoides (strain CBS 100239) TaxID=1163406 RepID=A0A0L0NLI7_TOLOC|nr:hypothetical protein TOPH_00533 [Tolypocladium ophioglossoides CBS 100239]
MANPPADEMEEALLLPQHGGAPPPYEAKAYPRQRRRRYTIPVQEFWKIIDVNIYALVCIAVDLCLFLVAGDMWPPREAGPAPSSTLKRFEDAIAQCDAISRLPTRDDATTRKTNSRWNPKSGQKETIVLRNATVFDGEAFLPHAVDITFSKGLVVSISEASGKTPTQNDAVEHDLHGRYVTPGLVDMHSHHMIASWPAAGVRADENEMNALTKAFTPMVRVIDGLKAYDMATNIICSGGITTLRHIIGGEGSVVKNALYSGEHGEPVVEDLLLERGIPHEERRRYVKMAFGENPTRVRGHTRMGVAWHLREHFQKAKELKERQDDYCDLFSNHRDAKPADKVKLVRKSGNFPFQLDLDTSIGILRGRVIVQNHNYEQEDMETMLRISHEFGYQVRGFHHAAEAWQIPELLKEKGENVTLAIFAEFSLYKWESYSPSLYAGHILDKHGIPVAYKSDHVTGPMNAKYLASQAAIGHSFHLPEDKALQAITSLPAKAIELDHRVGYCRPGYDADLVVWDSHPLSVGATPLQVFVDGIPQLDDSKVKESTGTTFSEAEKANDASQSKPQIRYEPEASLRNETCSLAAEADQKFIIKGIHKTFLESYPELAMSVTEHSEEPLDLVVDSGKIICLGPTQVCSEKTKALEADGRALKLSLQNGHLLPGLTAVAKALGMREIATEEETGDGDAKGQKIGDPDSVAYAKHGIWLDGKSFARARMGGVTRAITAPVRESGGMVQGVSVEILTSGRKSLLDGGIVQDNVALHLVLDEGTKASEDTVGAGVQHLRKMLRDGKHNVTIYGKVQRGELPLVVTSHNKYDLQQLIMIKRDFPGMKLVIMGRKETPSVRPSWEIKSENGKQVAKDLAAANTPVILTKNRPSGDQFRSRDAVIGPPLSRSVASHLTEAGVTFALAIAEDSMPVDYRLNSLGPEAGWAAKYAGLNEGEAVRLATTNVESILDLNKSKDLVVFEGNPLQYGATAVLSFHADAETGKLEVATCFPREE